MELDADDALAAALWGLLDAALRYDAARGVSFSSYAVPRIDGEIAEMARTTRRRRTVQLVPDRVPTSPATVDLVCSDEVARTVRAAVGRLPDRQRAVVEAVDLGHQTQRALARRWGLTDGRVSQIRSQALRRLRRDMEHHR